MTETRSTTGATAHARRPRAQTGVETGTGARKGGTGHGPLLGIAADIALPLLVYYAARALGADQGPALLLSGAPPALRLLYGALRHRRIDGVDLFFTVLLAGAALVSLIGGGPRVLLFKDAALSLVVGTWMLGTGFSRRPLAFQLGQRLHQGPAARARAGLWRDSAEFRRALRALTLGWGAEQLLDGGLGTLAAAALPTDTVPLLTRLVSLSLLALTAAATAGYARRFRTRHGLPLLGAPGTEHTDRTNGTQSPSSPSSPPSPSAPAHAGTLATTGTGIRTPLPPRPPARRPS